MIVAPNTHGEASGQDCECPLGDKPEPIFKPSWISPQQCSLSTLTDFEKVCQAWKKVCQACGIQVSLSTEDNLGCNYCYGCVLNNCVKVPFLYQFSANFVIASSQPLASSFLLNDNCQLGWWPSIPADNCTVSVHMVLFWLPNYPSWTYLNR